MIVLFDLDYYVDLYFLCFHKYKTSQLGSKSWWMVPVRYTKINFGTKMILVPQNGVPCREVSAISVRYKVVFLRDYDRDSIHSY